MPISKLGVAGALFHAAGLSRSHLPAAGMLIAAAAMSSPWPLHAADSSAGAANAAAIGMVGTQHITETELIAADQEEFDRLQHDYEVENRQLDFKFAQARHDLLQQQLDKRLDRSALELEAKSRGIPASEVLAALKISAPTEDEARAFYEANKERLKQPYDAVASKIRDYLTTQRNEEFTRKFYDELRAKHGISSRLGPYRVSVAATGPARGEPHAPVTIVEFADFQCPYCKEAEATLRTLIAQYPHEVRIVFRNLPLTRVHPNAEIAAEAAVCADRQGKFWEMHDAMYDDQRALDAEALKRTALRLGLDEDRFSACLADAGTKLSLDGDAKAAMQLGLQGTPYFFINGRPLNGSLPLEKFQSVIAEELHHASPDQG